MWVEKGLTLDYCYCVRVQKFGIHNFRILLLVAVYIFYVQLAPWLPALLEDIKVLA